jgi:hypothetical protein
MEPASSIIEKLGGEGVVSKITRTAYTAPYRWQHPRDKGGTGGLIPQRYHPLLLDHARRHGIALKAEDFLPRTGIGSRIRQRTMRSEPEAAA